MNEEYLYYQYSTVTKVVVYLQPISLSEWLKIKNSIIWNGFIC